MKKINTIIFDWGRTLHDPETDSLFPKVLEIISWLHQRGYRMALVSLAKSQDPEKRREVINESGIAGYFEEILVGDEGKDDMYEKVLEKFGIAGNEVAVVDDRVVRGIAWGNRNGAITVWFQNGKFADELPSVETGEPTHTITAFTELKPVFSL